MPESESGIAEWERLATNAEEVIDAWLVRYFALVIVRSQVTDLKERVIAEQEPLAGQ